VSDDRREPTQRFSDRVDAYVRYRPGYPSEVVRTLERELGIRPGTTRVVDIGTGTGISAELFLRDGYDVVGVEPNEAMRAAAQKRFAGEPRFRILPGSAEATTLPDASANLVLAAQAFHWFDRTRARAEIARILAPGGALALVWNDRHTDTTPFLRGYEDALRSWSIDYGKVNHQNLSDAEVGAFFRPTGCDIRTFPYHQDFDWEGLLGRAMSSSYVPLRGQPGHDELVAVLRDLFDRHAASGSVRFEYDTKLFFGPLGP
jgi:SAM-dependent methyltransferase